MPRIYNVLVLCTANSARSVLGEVAINQLPGGRFRAYSAGSKPRGQINEVALQFLQQQGLPTAGLRSKSWDEFAAPDAPVMDFVFTACDAAANEPCPYWPGAPISAHWGMPDPAGVGNTPDEALAAFATTYATWQRRLALLVALPIDTLSLAELRQHCIAIGQA